MMLLTGLWTWDLKRSNKLAIGVDSHLLALWVRKINAMKKGQECKQKRYQSPKFSKFKILKFKPRNNPLVKMHKISKN